MASQYSPLLAQARRIAGTYLVVHFVVPDHPYAISYTADETATTIVYRLAEDVKTRCTVHPAATPALFEVVICQSDGPVLYQLTMPNGEPEWQLLIATHDAPGDQHRAAERSFTTRRVIWRIVQQTGGQPAAIQQMLRTIQVWGGFRVRSLNEDRQVQVGVASVNLASSLQQRFGHTANAHAVALRRRPLTGRGDTARHEYPELAAFTDRELLGIFSAAAKLLRP